MNQDYLQIHHVSLLVSDMSRALDFYTAVLGLESNPDRPDLGYPGAWLDIGGQQIHLMQLDGAAPRLQAHMGHERHLAIQVRTLENIETRLQAAGVEYRKSRSGRAALFCRDPDDNTLEFVEKIG